MCQSTRVEIFDYNSNTNRVYMLLTTSRLFSVTNREQRSTLRVRSYICVCRVFAARQLVFKHNTFRVLEKPYFIEGVTCEQIKSKSVAIC